MKNILQKDKKTRILNMNRYKAMITTDRTRKNKWLIAINSRHASKIKFTDNLWVPFLEQPQSGIFVFAMILVDIYKYMLK